MSRSRHENVYVIGGEIGPQKIGISNNLESRLINLQSGRPYQLRLVTRVHRPNGDARAVERVAHQLLREKRLDGEWFGVSIEEAIDAVNRAVAMIDAGEIAPRRPRAPQPNQMGVRLDEAERAALERAAAADHRPISAMLRKIAAEWLRQNGWLKDTQK